MREDIFVARLSGTMKWSLIVPFDSLCHQSLVHGDSLLFLRIVCHSLVDGWQGGQICDLADAKEGMGAGTKEFFDCLQSAVAIVFQLVLLRGSLFRN
jgi:hypothetical protein